LPESSANGFFIGAVQTLPSSAAQGQPLLVQ